MSLVNRTSIGNGVPSYFVREEQNLGLARYIPKGDAVSTDGECVEFVKDAQWMSFVVDLFGVASHSSSLMGGGPAEYVPYLGIFGAPVYLYHAAKASVKYFQLMGSAFRVSRIADVCFWGGKGIGAFGNALSSIIKPLAGGIALAGIAHLPTLGLLFNHVFPITLIVLSGIGGATQWWDMTRTKKVLKKYKKLESKHLDGSLTGLHKLLVHLQGPQLDEHEHHTPHAKDLHKLRKKHFKNHHFTNKAREEEIQSEISNFVGVHYRFQRYIDQFQKNIGTLFSDLEINMNFFNPESPTLEKIDRMIALSDKLLIKMNPEQELYKKLKTGRDELNQHKQEIYTQGVEIVDTIHSEIHRKLSEQTLLIIASLITLVAGILFLAYPHYSEAGYYLSLSASILGVITVIYHKGLSKESFLYIERKLGILPSKKNLPLANLNQMA